MIKKEKREKGEKYQKIGSEFFFQQVSYVRLEARPYRLLAFILLGSVLIPSEDTTCPRYLKSLGNKCHFDRFNFSLYFKNLSNVNTWRFWRICLFHLSRPVSIAVLTLHIYRKTPFLVSGTAIEIYFFTWLMYLILFAI